MNEGWIKVSRHLANHEIWLSEKFTDGQAWVDLLMLANHKKNFINIRGIRLDIERGQCGYSILTLAKRWKWSRGKVTRFLHFLEQQNMINVIQQKNCVSTIISITNYMKYQDGSTANSAADIAASRTAKGQQTDTNKNVKNEKEEKNKIPHAFEEFHKLYPGTKSGVVAAYENFLIKNNQDTIPHLMPGLEKELKYHELLKAANKFEPNWKNLTTWINNRCWEQELPEIKTTPTDSKPPRTSKQESWSESQQKWVVL